VVVACRREAGYWRYAVSVGKVRRSKEYFHGERGRKAETLGRDGDRAGRRCDGTETADMVVRNERAEIVAAKAEKLTQAMRDCGCTLNNAYMQHSLLALVVIPELRISDVGLVDVRTFEKVELFV
jgi:hypothetical protein